MQPFSCQYCSNLFLLCRFFNTSANTLFILTLNWGNAGRASTFMKEQWQSLTVARKSMVKHVESSVYKLHVIVSLLQVIYCWIWQKDQIPEVWFEGWYHYHCKLSLPILFWHYIWPHCAFTLYMQWPFICLYIIHTCSLCRNGRSGHLQSLPAATWDF